MESITVVNPDLVIDCLESDVSVEPGGHLVHATHLQADNSLVTMVPMETSVPSEPGNSLDDAVHLPNNQGTVSIEFFKIGVNYIYLIFCLHIYLLIIRKLFYFCKYSYDSIYFSYLIRKKFYTE